MAWLCLWHGEDVRKDKEYPMSFLDMTDETSTMPPVTRDSSEELSEEESEGSDQEDSDLSMALCEAHIAQWEMARIHS